jgi:hypothetical protein
MTAAAITATKKLTRTTIVTVRRVRELMIKQ